MLSDLIQGQHKQETINLYILENKITLETILMKFVVLTIQARYLQIQLHFLDRV